MQKLNPSIQRSLICFWEGYLGVAPSIVGAIKHLSRAGIAVDVLMLRGDPSFPPPPTLPPNVTIRTIPCLARAPFLTKLPPRARYLAFQLARLFDLLRLITAARGLGRNIDFGLVIGVDMFGIIVASAVPKKHRRTLAYWSLELRFLDSVRNPLMRLAKKLETVLLKGADLIVVQDSERASALAAENSITTDRMAFVPNSPSGLSSIGTSCYLHKRLAIDRSKKIILHAGMICPEVMSIELANSASALDEKYILVFHERQQRNPTEPYLRSVQAAGGPRVRLSLNPVSLDDVDKVYASAFIGIVIYSDEYGSNFTEIAFASGKLSYLLHNRVPVVVNSIPSLKRFVEETGCGVVVNDLREIPNAIDRIANNYGVFKERAEQAFLKHLDFAVYFEKAFSEFV